MKIESNNPFALTAGKSKDINPVSYIKNYSDSYERNADLDAKASKRKAEYEIPEGISREDYFGALANEIINRFITDGRILPAIKDKPISYLFLDTFGNSFEDYMIDRLKNGGIKTVGDFKKFLDQTSKIQKNYGGILHKFIDCYGSLKDKEDIKNFPETIILSQVVQKFSKGETDINTYVDFMKETGVMNEGKFFRIYENYSDDFNGFETPLDKYDLIKYVQESYHEKFDGFKQIIDPKSTMKDKDLRKLYFKNHAIIDYLYEQNQEEWSAEFSKIYNSSTNEKYLNNDAKSKLSNSSFGSIDDIENKIKLFEFLDKKEIEIKEINGYVKNNYVNDLTIDEILQHREKILENIQEKGYDKKSALQLYANYKDTLNSCFGKDNEFASGDSIASFLELTENFNIKDDKGFYALYKNITKNSSPNKDDVSSFIDTLSFADKKQIANFRRNKNYNILNEASKNQEKYGLIDENYINFVAPDGTSAFSLFKKTFNPQEVNNRMQLLFYQISPEEEETFNSLLPYFSTPDEAKKFIKNNVNQNGRKNYRQFSESCIKIVSAMSDIKEDDYVQKLNDSGIIKNSKRDILKIVETYKTKEDLALFFKTALDKKISNASMLYDLFEKYQDKNGDTNNVLKHFASLENISFKQYGEYLDYVQNALKRYQLPVTLDNSNIINLPPYPREGIYTDFSKKENVFVANCANSLTSNKDKNLNFVAKTGNIHTKTRKNADRLQIANEFCRHWDKEFENYSSLIEKLFPKLNKKALENLLKNPELLAKRLPKDFVNFINKSTCFKLNNRKLDIALHAKLRTFERFVTDERYDFEQMDYKKAEAKIKDVYKTIYRNNPYKIVPAHKKDCYVCYYKYDGSYTGEIKAVFSKSGQLITIAAANR